MDGKEVPTHRAYMSKSINILVIIIIVVVVFLVVPMAHYYTLIWRNHLANNVFFFFVISTLPFFYDFIGTQTIFSLSDQIWVAGEQKNERHGLFWFNDNLCRLLSPRERDCLEYKDIARIVFIFLRGFRWCKEAVSKYLLKVVTTNVIFMIPFLALAVDVKEYDTYLEIVWL